MPSSLHILFVGLSPQAVEVLGDVLRQGGYHLHPEQLHDLQNLPAKLATRLDILLVDSLTQHPYWIKQIHTLLTEHNLDIPVLVYSSVGDEASIVAAMQAGAKDYISSKNPQRILSSVRRELLYARQRAGLRKVAQQNALLQEIESWMLSGLDIIPLTQRICERIVEIFAVRVAWIGGKQESGEVNIVAASAAIELLRQMEVRWDDTPHGRGSVGLAIKTRQAVTLTVDALELNPWRKMAEDYGVQSVLAVPIMARDEVIGVLNLYSEQRAFFDAASVKRYVAFTSRLAIILLLVQEQEQYRLLSAAMNKATQAIFITKQDGMIVWFNQALRDFSGYSAQEIMDSTPHLFSSGCFEKGYWEELWQTILQGNIWSGDALNRRKDGSLYNVLQTITPLKNSAGEVTHFLCVQQDVSDKKELERKIEFLAYHDVLTGLPNRSLFNDRMQQAISQSKRDQCEFALLFVDLDGFKGINDSFGHAVGDQLLQMVADRLRASVREGDTVARLGGDEFMVLLRAVSDDLDLKNIVSKLIERLARPYELSAGYASITASVGVSRYPSDGRVAEKLMSCADEAMYQAKHAGKNRYSLWYSPETATATSDWQI